MNNPMFIITAENVKNHKDINFITIEIRRCQNQIIIQQFFFSDNLLAIEMERTQTPTSLLRPINTELKKIVLYEFWYDYINSYTEKNQNYVTRIKTALQSTYIYVDFAKDVETRFNTSNNELDKPLPKGKNLKTIIGLMKDKIG